MPASKAQQKAVNKYVKENYDDIRFRVAKGKKEIIREHAAKNGESVNAFLNRVVDEAIERNSDR